MKIYTKTGDKGQTSLLGGTRVPKYNVRIEAYGVVDELNSYIGLLATELLLIDYQDLMHDIQQVLFNIGSHLANDPAKSQFALPEFPTGMIERLESSIDSQEENLTPLKNFVLPGGHPTNVWAHVARTVCRRAERRVVELNDQVEVEEFILVFLNRLSDWLFVLARTATDLAGVEEVKWKS